MKTRLSVTSVTQVPLGWPDEASLAAFRAWCEGMPSREAVDRYLVDRRAAGASSRSIIGRVKRELVEFADSRGRAELAKVLQEAQPGRKPSARRVSVAIEELRSAPMPAPLIGDEVDRWLPARLSNVLRAAGLKTLADLTLRVPRRRRWWSAIPGLGARGAKQIEAFFADHLELTARARALVVAEVRQDLVPWERLVVPSEVDGSRGAYRAPRGSCVLSANNDYQAVQAWLSLHESTATQRAYRKEAERLILWAIVDRGRPLSSLTTEDAIAYRAFLRHPAPRGRWIGPPRPRNSSEWRPFAGPLSARSAAYTLSVLGALFRCVTDRRNRATDVRHIGARNRWVVLLCHKRSLAFMRRQHGHRGSVLSKAAAISSRKVVMDEGTWRCVRWAAARLVMRG